MLNLETFYLPKIAQNHPYIRDGFYLAMKDNLNFYYSAIFTATSPLIVPLESLKPGDFTSTLSMVNV
jgi:hypothetical protein